MEFLGFFTEMSWVVILLLGISLILGVTEALTPGFGFCGITSVLFSAGALVVEGIFTKSVFAVLFIFILIVLLALVLFIIFVHSARKGHLSKTPIIEGRCAISDEYSSNQEKIILVGRVGVVVSECKPVGKASFDGKELTVISKSGNLITGKLIVVEEVRDNFIFVKELKGEKNE